jgi:hypothetical protein
MPPSLKKPRFSGKIVKVDAVLGNMEPLVTVDFTKNTKSKPMSFVEARNHAIPCVCESIDHCLLCEGKWVLSPQRLAQLALQS